MEREVTLLNKSNKFVSVKWLARIAFHVGQCSRTCATVSWVWHVLHWGGLSLFSWKEALQSRKLKSKSFSQFTDWLHRPSALTSPLIMPQVAGSHPGLSGISRAQFIGRTNKTCKIVNTIDIIVYTPANSKQVKLEINLIWLRHFTIHLNYQVIASNRWMISPIIVLQTVLLLLYLLPEVLSCHTDY